MNYQFKFVINTLVLITISLVCCSFSGDQTITYRYNPGNSIEKTGTINGHDYVDLGLPSGLKWATSNIGAVKPEEYGSYFAWGEIKPKTEYTPENNETLNKDQQWLSSNGYTGEKGHLASAHDAASQKWGSTWKVPSLEDFQELINYTTISWTTINGINGCLAKSKINGNCIFFPAGGYYKGGTLEGVESLGIFCTSTPFEENSEGAYFLVIHWASFGSSPGFRSGGYTVRPVSK